MMQAIFIASMCILGAILSFIVLIKVLAMWELRHNTRNRKILLRFFDTHGVPKSTWLGEYTTEWKLESGVKIYLHGTEWWAILDGRWYVTKRFTGWCNTRDHRFILDLLVKVRDDEHLIKLEEKENDRNDTAK